MQLADIPHAKPGAIAASRSSDGSERSNLAVLAAKKLGYSGLQAEVTGKRSLGRVIGPLTEALLRLEIEVLDSASVLRYQIEEAGRITLEEAQRHFEHWAIGWFSAASWQHTELSVYTEPIPEFVIRKALQIKDALPEVKFFIQHMSDPKADPFLIASLGEEIYYIEAWAEPKFERNL